MHVKTKTDGDMVMALGMWKTSMGASATNHALRVPDSIVSDITASYG